MVRVAADTAVARLAIREALELSLRLQIRPPVQLTGDEVSRAVQDAGDVLQQDTPGATVFVVDGRQKHVQLLFVQLFEQLPVDDLAILIGTEPGFEEPLRQAVPSPPEHQHVFLHRTFGPARNVFHSTSRKSG